MTTDSHIRRGHPIIFGLMILFGLVEVAISAWLSARYGLPDQAPNGGIKTRTHFILFGSIWTIVIAFIYSILFFHSATGSILTSVLSHAIFLFLTWIFWTGGAAAITAALGGGLNCNNTAFRYCGQLNAMEAFAWMIWILVTFALITVIIRGILSSRRGDGMRGPLVAA